ncbi:patatin-like phospholipase family protein [Pigmentiphaga litoralis]|uniref:Patatin-like phospholipase n=1 Tax=Pigmentiphaga litoralis TaxID=516702 RepID=A0A7Y9LJD3_9BURK|nr:hypothetical protein [Pigmentiphaga litoralis]NYE81854.1 hypothetical protein [Pigmentiphaga litoralis]
MKRLDTLVDRRRKILQDPDLPEGHDNKWGLALSGGGIRSATFALGLVTALAKKKMLLRFDLLSTVSGGGYAGATIGRLFDRVRAKAAVVDADKGSTGDAARAVQEGLARDEATWTTWWLRANGRYLIPSGVLDGTLIVALYVRNVLAVHFELALLALLAGIFLACVNLFAWTGLAALGWIGGDTFFDAFRWLSPWLPVPWIALAVFTVIGAIQTSAFWCFPYVRKRGASHRAFAVVITAMIAIVALHPLFDTAPGRPGSVVREGLWVTMVALMFCWLLGALYAQRIWIKARRRLPDASSAAADVLSVLTQRLSNTFRWGIAFLALGIVERFAWHLAFEPSGFDTATVGIVLTIVAPALRAALPFASRLTNPTAGVRLGLLIGRGLGYLIVALLAAFWMSLAYRAVLGAYFDRTTLAFWPALTVAVLLMLPMAIYLAVTGRNIEFLNLSSLHSFYRARLVRSYLGAANYRRFEAAGPLDEGTLTPVPADLPLGKVVSEVEEVHLDDDVAINDYRPMDAGGPVHLITMCVNQTNDPRGGIFNRDRQGLPLTIVSGGYMREGIENWSEMRREEPLSLGTFIAISGAAIAPALGALTRGGISALAMFAGLRLGYWWSNERRNGEDTRSVHAWTGKSRRILNELRGRFQGTQGPDWFLTDGGHFENTGAYALLAERCRVIVVSDAGADPTYAFGDLENLVRKARIDLNADIRFMRPRNPPDLRLSPPVAELAQFGTIDDLASSKSNACMALATVIYAEDPLHPGILIYMKPNFFIGLPVDLVNFKAANPYFPQEPTSDQFFSESQWESYFLLGQEMGKALSIDLLNCIAAAPDAYFVQDTSSTLDKALTRDKNAVPAGAPATPMQAISRIPARIAVSTVKATVGLTAVAAIGASAWQGLEAWRTAREKSVDTERTALSSLSSTWLETQRARASDTPQRVEAVSRLATTLLYTADRICAHGQAEWFQQPGLAREIAIDAFAECRKLDVLASRSCAVLLQSVGNPASRTVNTCLGPLLERPPQRYETYWAYDYTTRASPHLLHPCDRYRQDLRLEAMPVTITDAVDPPAAGCRLGTFAFGVPGEAIVRTVMAGVNDGFQYLQRLAGLNTHDLWLSRFARDRGSDIAIADSSPAAAAPAPSALEPFPATDARVVASASVPAPAALPARPIAPPPPTVIDAEARAACSDVAIFVQVYDRESYDAALRLRGPWSAIQARFQPIENVQQSAEARGRPNLTPVTEPTIRYHRNDAAACAAYLWPVARQTLTLPGPVTPRPLAARFPSTPSTIEVWLPPRTAITTREAAAKTLTNGR